MKKLTVVLLLLTLSLLCSCAGAPRVSVTGGTAVTTPGESVADTEEKPATEQTDAAEEAVESVNLDQSGKYRHCERGNAGAQFLRRRTPRGLRHGSR